MDDFQTILYIVVGLLYFLSRGIKKKKPPVKPNRQVGEAGEEQDQNRPPKALTFEELLKEFTEGKEAEEVEEASPPPPPTRSEPPHRSRSPLTSRREEDDDEIAQPARRRFADEDSRRIYEQSIKSAENLKSDHSSESSYGFKRYEDHSEEETTAGAEIAEILKEEDGARKAIILSEILNRKY